MFIYDLTPTLNFVQIMKYNAYAKIRDNEVNIDVVKQTRKRLKIKLYGQKTLSTKLSMYVSIP